MKLDPKLALLGAKQALGIMVDPAPAYKFFIYVELSGIIEAKFTECTGLSMERETQTHYEGGNNDWAHHLPGRVKYSNITLKRGITFSRTLWDWFYNPETKSKYTVVEKVPLSIILYSAYSLLPARWYDLEDAFPVKLTGPNLNTDSTEIAIEELEIAYGRITLNQPSQAVGKVTKW